MAFGFYKTFTTDHTQAGSTNTSNFVVYIWVTDADLKTVGNGGVVQNANGYDIRPFSNVGLSSAFTYYLIFYDGTAGKVFMAVKIPTLSHTADVVSYLGLGDSGITTDGSSSSTWTSGYQGVWPMREGSGTNASDLSGNGNALTLQGTAGSVFWTTGTLGPFAIDDLTGNNLGLSNHQSGSVSSLLVPANGDWTASQWIHGIYGTANSALLSQWSGGTGWMLYLPDATGSIRLYADGNFAAFANVIPNDGNWHLVVGVKSGSNAIVYLDGASQGTVGIGSSSFGDPSTVLDQNNYDAVGVYAKGYYDLTYLNNTALSADQLLAEYNNQKTGTTFLTWGSLTPVGGATSWGPLLSDQLNRIVQGN